MFMSLSAVVLFTTVSSENISRIVAFVFPSVHTSMDSDFSEVYGPNSLKLYKKIRYGLRIMQVK